MLQRAPKPEPGPVERPRITDPKIRRYLVRTGLNARWSDDLYHRTLRLSWPQFFLLIALAYGTVNLIFGILYFAQPGSILNSRPGFFRDAFFFSVETFGTIGYGVLAPGTDYANVLMTLETLIGLTFTAITTGIMFARISRPTARVLFSDSAVIAIHEGVPTLMVRAGNARPNQILEADASLALLRNEISPENLRMRRFYDLKLERSHTPIFALSFTVMHKIDEASPLFGLDTASLADMDAEFILSLTGLDETSAQPVYARHSYLARDLRFGHAYIDMISLMPDGKRLINYALIHETREQGL